MNSRKRQAPEPLLPLRFPKQPRLALVGYNGGAPSPSEKEGILSRWLKVGNEVAKLTYDTVMILMPCEYSKALIYFSIPYPLSSNVHI